MHLGGNLGNLNKVWVYYDSSLVTYDIVIMVKKKNALTFLKV